MEAHRVSIFPLSLLVNHLCYLVGNDEHMLAIMDIPSFDHGMRVDTEALQQAST